MVSFDAEALRQLAGIFHKYAQQQMLPGMEEEKPIPKIEPLRGKDDPQTHFDCSLEQRNVQHQGPLFWDTTPPTIQSEPGHVYLPSQFPPLTKDILLRIKFPPKQIDEFLSIYNTTRKLYNEFYRAYQTVLHEIQVEPVAPNISNMTLEEALLAVAPYYKAKLNQFMGKQFGRTGYLISNIFRQVARGPDINTFTNLNRDLEGVLRSYKKIQRNKNKINKFFIPSIQRYLSRPHIKKEIEWINANYPQFKNELLENITENLDASDLFYLSKIEKAINEFDKRFIEKFKYKSRNQFKAGLNSAIREKTRKRLSNVLSLLSSLQDLNDPEKDEKALNALYHQVSSELKRLGFDLSLVDKWILKDKFVFQYLFLKNLLSQLSNPLNLVFFNISIYQDYNTLEEALNDTAWVEKNIHQAMMSIIMTGALGSATEGIGPAGRDARQALYSLEEQNASNSTDMYKRFIKVLSPPFSPEFSLQLIKHLVKNSLNQPRIFNLFDDLNSIDVDIIYDILERKDKININDFLKFFDYPPIHIIEEIYRDTPPQLQPYFSKHLSSFLKKFNNLTQDLTDYQQIVSAIHNSAYNISPAFYEKILRNPNTKLSNKLDINEKLLNNILNIAGSGGVAAIKRKYAKNIDYAIQHNIISSNFDENLNEIIKFFTQGMRLYPQMENFEHYKNLILKVNTDLQTIKEMESLIKLYDKAKENPKIPQLFDLNWQINPRLRFRVLKDLDPMYFKVGLITDCCQRVGGAAESAAEDSFINPQAGVVVLEWQNPRSNWEILAQSYFHYIPADNAFILDNVETNGKALTNSGINLERVYAWWAAQIKAKFDIKYMEAGTGCSDLGANVFERSDPKDDPRQFSSENVYSDWHDNGHNIDLLSPKIEVEDLNPEEWSTQ